MLGQSVNQLQGFTAEPSNLVVKRIELFVIPALAVDSAGHRVCLRITSNLGYGWSELFVGEAQHEIELDRWSDLLACFIGSVSLPPLHDCYYEKTALEGRIFELFATAVIHVMEHSSDSPAFDSEAEESVLRTRASHYVSLV